MSRKKENLLVIDVETANNLIDGLTYDIGFIVADRYSNIYEKRSFVIYEIYRGERELMNTCYYASKIPQYEIAIKNGDSKIVTILTAKRIVAELMRKYEIKKVFAYNLFFDKTMLNTSLRYITKSAYRWFFPYGTEFCDIWNFACSTICQKKKYKTFCEENGYISNGGKNYRATAETVFQFINNDTDFKEEHKGLDDVLIEYDILLECYKMHKKVETDINRLCWQKVRRE